MKESTLSSRIERLRHEIDGEFKPYELDRCEREIVNLLETFVREMSNDCCKRCKDLIAIKTQEDISNYRCESCRSNKATNWTGFGRACESCKDKLPEDERIKREVYENMTKGIKKLDNP